MPLMMICLDAGWRIWSSYLVQIASRNTTEPAASEP